MPGPWDKYGGAQPASGPWAKYGSTQSAPAAAPAPSGPQPEAENPVSNLGLGITKGFWNTASGVSRLINKIPGIGETLAPKEGIDAMQEIAKPRGTAQKLGYGAEQTGEYFLAPEAEGASLPLKAAIQAGGAGIVSGLQSHTREGALTGAAAGAVTPFAQKAVGALADAVGPRIYNTIIRPASRDFRYGANPGRAVYDEGIIAGSKPSLLNKVKAAREAVGSDIGSTLSSPANAARLVDKGPAIHSVDDAVDEALRLGNPDLADQYQKLGTQLTTTYRRGPQGPIGSPRAFAEPPADVNELKQAVGAETNWGSPYATEVNKLKRGTYGRLRDAIEQQVPEVGPLNKRWGGLREAETDLQNAIGIQQRSAPISLSDIGYGIGFGGLGAMHDPATALATGIGSIALKKGLGSTAAKTLATQGLRGSPRLFPLAKAMYLADQ